MKRLGKKHIQINLANPIEEMPQKLKDLSLELSEDKINLYYHFKDKKEYQNIPLILQTIKDCGLNINELNTSKSSLEDIFVDIVNDEY
jgi:ABC-2 type transport system ATP-binding protein